MRGSKLLTIMKGNCILSSKNSNLSQTQILTLHLSPVFLTNHYQVQILLGDWNLSSKRCLMVLNYKFIRKLASIRKKLRMAREWGFIRGEGKTLWVLSSLEWMLRSKSKVYRGLRGYASIWSVQQRSKFQLFRRSRSLKKLGKMTRLCIARSIYLWCLKDMYAWELLWQTKKMENSLFVRLCKERMHRKLKELWKCFCSRGLL